MRWYVKVMRRPVYLAPSDDKLNHKQLIAQLPAHPIPKCKMDISVLVLLTIDKYRYHLPVWRQQQRLRQYGIDLPYSSLCSLVNRTCEVLEPLWNLLLKEIMVSDIMNMDETTYRVLDNSKKKGKKSHAYTLNNYTALIRYTEDGMLPIDNNQLEGQIRAIALGRHNHLFAGSHRGGTLGYHL